jgi:hypothetical protein
MRVLTVCVVAVGIIILCCFGCVVSSSSSSNARPMINRWFQLRVGGREYKHGTLWHYHGVLRNPYNGKSLADIEGIELLKPVFDPLVYTLQTSSTEASIPQVMSKKLFFYLQPGTDRLLESFKLSPISRARKVNAIKEYHQLISIGQLTAGSSNDSNTSIITTCTFPGGRQLVNKNLAMATGSSIDEVDAGDDKRSLRIRNFMKYSPNNYHDNNRESSWFHLPKLISFSPVHIGGRSQEQYILREAKPISFLGRLLGSLRRTPPVGAHGITMSYQRIGDAPSWVSSRAMCIIELQAERYQVSSLSSIRNVLPPRLLHLVQKHRPDFITEIVDASDAWSMDSFYRNSSMDLLHNYRPWYKRFLNWT